MLTKRAFAVLFALFGLVCLPGTAVAQAFTQWSISEMLREYSSSTDSMTILAARRQLNSAIVGWKQYPRASADSIPSGLASIILTTADERKRRSALSHLLVAGVGWDGKPAMPGVTKQLVDIYERSTDPSLKASILMFTVERLEEREPILDLLARLAVGEGEESVGLSLGVDVPVQAVGHLSRMGPAGRQVLERLQRDGSVRNSQARARLGPLIEEASTPTEDGN